MNAGNPDAGLRGRWEIVSRDGHAADDLHVEVRAFIEFRDDGVGAFHFAFVRGGMEYTLPERNGPATVEFTFDAHDGAEPLSGHGWAARRDERLAGTFVFHTGSQVRWIARRGDLDQPP